MTIAFVAIWLVLLIREIMFMNERKAWQDERKELYSRIQAGSLQEYLQTTKEPAAPAAKDREQRVSEEAEKLGIQRQDLQYPAHWGVSSTPIKQKYHDKFS